jgi:LacI family transcriptional regulator
MIESLSSLKTVDSQTPRVSQIKQAIRGQVQSGRLLAGTKLPSLAQLAELFDCSLGLVRQAINTLVAEGVLTSQPRKGLFVAENRPAVADIMLVSPTSHMENMQRIFEGVRMGLEQSPYRMVLHAANFDYDEQMTMLNDLDPQTVAGVLILPPPFASQAEPLLRFSQKGIPVVQVGRSLVDLDLDAVVADGVELGRSAMEHMLAFGHRHIGYVCNRTDYHFNRELLEGFELALRPHQLSMDDVAVTYVSATDLNSEQPWLNGQKAATHLLGKHPDVTGVIGMNPHITLGVYKAVQASGKAVGKGVSVLGLFSDLSFFTALEPAVSVVCCDLQQIGQRAALLLRQRIENPNMPRRTLCLSSQLVARQSVDSVS